MPWIYHLDPHRGAGKSLAAIVVTTSHYGECPGDRVNTYMMSRAVGQLPSLQYLPEPKDSKQP